MPFSDRGDSHRLRTLLSSRARLVDMRRDLGTKIRGRSVLKTFGKIIGEVGDRGFEARVRELAAGETGLEEAASALLAVREAWSSRSRRSGGSVALSGGR